MNGVVPSPAGDALPIDKAFEAEINELTATYIRQLEAVQVRDALKTVMAISAAGNKYTQDTKPWLLIKSKVEAERLRCQRVVSLTVHAIRWLAILLEPYVQSLQSACVDDSDPHFRYMPTVSDKICVQLKIKVHAGVLADQKAASALVTTVTDTKAKAADSKAAAAPVEPPTTVVFDTHAFVVGHVIGNPVPIFKEIKPEEVLSLPLGHLRRPHSGALSR